MKRVFFFLCLLCLILGHGISYGEDYRHIPDCLEFKMPIGQPEQLTYKTTLRRSYPETVLPHVNDEIRTLIDGLAQDEQLRSIRCSESGSLNVICRISRSGESAMSFLVLASKVEDQMQTGVAFENRVFDMASGERISLNQLFESDDVWMLLEEEIRSQLTAYYPAQTPDAAALENLCRVESIKNAAFSLTPARLELHYAASLLYPDETTVMHVRIPYAALENYLSAYGCQQTDNTGYKMVCLTFDDGPVRSTSLRVMDELMSHGANATFFVVGNRIPFHQEILCREQDSGFCVASHNYVHEYETTDTEQLFKWRNLFNRQLGEITGATAAIMRAPGGSYPRFIRAEIGMPLIQWDLISGDVTDDRSDAKVRGIAEAVFYQAKPGSIVLMHDLNYQSPQYVAMIMDGLDERDFFCVTVEELFLHYGVPLEANQVYHGQKDLPIPTN